MSRPKVLILQEHIRPYRVPIYKRIGKAVDLTVACMHPPKDSSIEGFSVVLLKHFPLGRFRITPEVLKLVRKFDVVISLPHFRPLLFPLLAFLPRKFKLIQWSIGVRASYRRNFSLEKNNSWGFRFWKMIFKRADALIFYTPLPIPLWEELGIPRERCFVAHNTVEVISDPPQGRPESILFVGTLYKEKKIDELIDAYLQASEGRPDFPRLDIVGNGDEFDRIQKLSQGHNIRLHGAVFDERVLAGLFANALVCVSPGQAGLSVLKSMGYSVPYVTRRNAITGGERSNISDGENGFLYDSYEQLVELLREVGSNPGKFIAAGRKAGEYYAAHASPEKMVNGVLQAIDFVTKHE